MAKTNAAVDHAVVMDRLRIELQEAIGEARTDGFTVRETRRERLFCTLTPTQQIERGQTLAEMTSKLRQLEDEKKRAAAKWKAAIDEQQGMIANLVTIVTDGEEEREVDVADLYDYRDGVVRTVRLDTSRTIATRAMTDADRQDLLPVVEEQMKGETAVRIDADAGGQDVGQDDDQNDGEGPIEAPADPWA